jgi:hypothetical protein
MLGDTDDWMQGENRAMCVTEQGAGSQMKRQTSSSAAAQVSKTLANYPT